MAKLLKQYKTELDRVEKAAARPGGETGPEENENKAYTLLKEYYNSLINSGEYDEAYSYSGEDVHCRKAKGAKEGLYCEVEKTEEKCGRIRGLLFN